MKKITFFSIVMLMVLALVAPALAQGQNGQGEMKAEKVKNILADKQEVKDKVVGQKIAEQKFVRRPVNIQGELVSMSGTTFPATLVVKINKLSPKKNKKWIGAYPEVGATITVKVEVNTKFVRKYWGKSSLEELTVGDKLDLTVKTNEDGSVTASRVKDDSLQWSWKVHNGTIENLDATNKTFTLMQKNGTTVSVKADDKTKVFVPTVTSSTFSNLQNGQMVHVRGVLNSKTKVLTANLVRVSVPKIEVVTTTSTATTTQ